jgi:site-specific DNA recombinase
MTLRKRQWTTLAPDWRGTIPNLNHLRCRARGRPRCDMPPKRRRPQPSPRSIPWQKPPSRKSRQILIPLGVPRNEVRPIRIERRARLVNAISRGRRWLDEILSGSATNIEQIATRQKCSVRQVNMTISLAFLAPDLVKAAVEGRLPRGIGVERLRDAPAEWSRQFEALGLNPQ